MVNKNLPVGAVFEDGGLYFEVQSVLPDGNYISKRIEKPKEPDKDKVPENVPETTKVPENVHEAEKATVEAPKVENNVTSNTQRKTTTRGRKK